MYGTRRQLDVRHMVGEYISEYTIHVLVDASILILLLLASIFRVRRQAHAERVASPCSSVSSLIMADSDRPRHRSSRVVPVPSMLYNPVVN
jgi:hypothetical protein